jgi:hypothetical protein
MFKRQLTLVLVCVFGALAFTKSQAVPASSLSRSQIREAQIVVRRIAVYRRATWHWESVMGVRRTPSGSSAARSPDLRYRRWVLRLWQSRAAQAQRRATAPPHKSDWWCIHQHEGSWHSNTGNGYYGGLQMDLGFQRHYGRDLLRRKGTADRWSPLEQMWVAERAHRSGRGFYPWPNTARHCGLI